MILINYGIGQQSPNWKTRDHTPPSWCRVYYILSGTVRYQCGDTVRFLKKEHLYIFPSYTAYIMDHDPEDPINCLWFHMDLFPTLVPSLIEIKPQGSLLYLLQTLRTKVLEMQIQNPMLTVTPYINCLCEAFTAWCMEENYLTLPDPMIAPMLQYISDHYEKPLHIQDISQQFGYSPEHLIRLFRKRIGLTPHQYLIGCRMNQALMLLRQDLTIHEIAQRCGYSDCKTFSNAFLHRYGIPPSVFRRFLIQQA